MAKNVAKMSENIAYKSSSLHNLLPAIPKLNVSTQPTNLTFSSIKYGKCIMLLLKILFKNSCFECLLFFLFFFVCWQWLELFFRLARLCTRLTVYTIKLLRAFLIFRLWPIYAVLIKRYKQQMRGLSFDRATNLVNHNHYSFDIPV